MKHNININDKKWIDMIWTKLKDKLCIQCERIGDKIPYISIDGCYTEDKAETNIYWWTNGFWAGMLWKMYSVTENKLYKVTAESIEQKLDRALEGYVGLHHDVGFMWLLSAVANYRITGNEKSKVRGLHAANLLAGRYNPCGKYIRAWNGSRSGWIIVDTMMNIPLLFWSSATTDDCRFLSIACEHANTTLKHIVRSDGSCNHIVVLNPENGDVLEIPNGQGFAAGSSWSRGQAWALYGFSLSYYYTKQESYLNAAKNLANYFIANISSTGYIPLADFRAPEKPVIFDTTAGTCAACGLLQLSEMLPELERSIYVDAAIQILKETDRRFCNWNNDIDSIVSNGAASYHISKESGGEAIIYGDYFLLEAILRLRDEDFMLW